MVWTTIIAVLVALGRYLFSYLSWGGLRDSFTVVVGAATVYGIAAVLNLWCFLGSRLSAAKSLIVIGFLTIGCIVNYYLLGDWLFSVVLLVNEVIFAAYLMLLRSSGLRFVKRVTAR